MDKLNTELFDTIHEFDTSKIPNEEMIEAKKKLGIEFERKKTIDENFNITIKKFSE